jgi:Domain of unknown function (DUF4499)
VPENPGVVRPPWGWFVLLDGGMVALALLSALDGARDAVAAHSPVPLPPRRVLRGILAGAAVIHVVEALAAGRYARRRGLPSRGWALQTLAVGFPSLSALHRATADSRRRRFRRAGSPR